MSQDLDRRPSPEALPAQARLQGDRRERVLVCVSEDPRSAGLVRYAERLADRLRAPWIAITVESRRSAHLSEGERDAIADALRLADQLGAETATIPAAGRRVAEDIVVYARDNNITQIVVGKSARSRWFELLNGSVVHDLVRRAGDISVHVIAGRDREGPAMRAASAPVATSPGLGTAPFAVAGLAVAVALGIGKLVQPVFGVENVDLVFLTAVVAVAIQFGLYPSLFAVALASISYNFFFLPPLYTFTIAEPTNVAALFFFALVAILVSNLGARARSQAVMSAMRARATEALYGFSRKLASCGTLDDVLWATAYQVALMLKVRVVLLLRVDNRLEIVAGYPPEDAIEEADFAAARWAFDNDRPAGRGTDTLPGAARLFMPLRTGRGTIGVVGIDSDKPGPLLTPEQRRLFDALADQGALAIERVYLVEDLDKARLHAETDRLRQALLTSLSHDLKTPLASVLGAASTLRDLDTALPLDAKRDLVTTIVEEAERLNRFIANLLDMTRLESGAVAPNLAEYDIAEVVGSALHRAAGILADRRVSVDLPPDLPPARIDAVLFEQVLFNLIDNAVKYSDPGTTVAVRGFATLDRVIIEIADEGSGIPAADLERVFDPFFRVRKSDHVRAGTGLGLAISRGFVEALGGTIAAANRSDRRGAAFTVSLPAAARPSPDQTA